MSSQEIIDIKNDYYNILTKYFKEIIFMVSLEKSELLKKVKLNDQEKWKKYFHHQKSTIVTASHYGNWEMNIVIFASMTDQRVIGFYKPISDKIIDDLMRKMRSEFGLVLYPIEKTARVMNELKNENVIYLFIGDQSPFNMNGVYWNQFLNQDTPWLNGSEKLATKYDLPVLYLQQQPVEDHDTIKYELKMHLISQHPKNEPKDAITQKYTEFLENEINVKPAYWLWSHKRWKRAHLKP